MTHEPLDTMRTVQQDLLANPGRDPEGFFAGHHLLQLDVLRWQHIMLVLDAFTDGRIDASLLEDWAEAVQGSDLVRFDDADRDRIAQTIFELSTPELHGGMQVVVHHAVTACPLPDAPESVLAGISGFCCVTLLLDFNITLRGGYRDQFIVIGTTCRVTLPDGTMQVVDIESSPMSAAPLLSVLRQGVTAITVVDSVLHMEFTGGTTIDVEPSVHHEAWQLSCDRGQAVCLPGGELAVW